MNGWKLPAAEGWVEQVWGAFAEDVGPGDLSSGCLEAGTLVDWMIEAQADGILCGAGVAHYVLVPEGDESSDAYCDVLMQDGDDVSPGDIILRGRSEVVKLLSRERTALNFLMHLSGIATHTSKFVKRLEGLDTQVVDTRKTVPGLRALHKYAVRCGGGKNHRLGLFDGIMIKDNHIAACGSITEAVRKSREFTGHMTKIEVECESLDQVKEAVQAGADVVMLDNMDPFMMQEAVRAYKGKVILEASGGVTLETVRGVASTGVDYVSVGALTHSSPALAFHLEVE